MSNKDQYERYLQGPDELNSGGWGRSFSSLLAGLLAGAVLTFAAVDIYMIQTGQGELVRHIQHTFWPVEESRSEAVSKTPVTRVNEIKRAAPPAEKSIRKAAVSIPKVSVPEEQKSSGLSPPV